MSQTLEQCIREHKRALKDFVVDVSELTEHVLTKNHSADWTSTKVIEYKANNYSIDYTSHDTSERNVKL